jgi:hypothetical protein
VVIGWVELMGGNLIGDYQISRSSLMKYLIMTSTEKLFDNVIKTIHARGLRYGHPITNHKRIAELWSAYLGYPIQPNEVAICMALVKISRQAEDPAYVDNYEDAIAYLSIGKSITDAMQDDSDDWKD